MSLFLTEIFAKIELTFENDGIDIHWPTIDEDLSLPGLLKYELAHFSKIISQIMKPGEVDNYIAIIL